MQCGTSGNVSVFIVGLTIRFESWVGLVVRYLALSPACDLELGEFLTRTELVGP